MSMHFGKRDFFRTSGMMKHLKLIVIPLIRYFGGHQAVQFRILREVIGKGNDRAAVDQQTLALAGLRDIGELMGGDVELLCENSAVAGSLGKQIDEVRVFKDVLNLRRSK